MKTEILKALVLDRALGELSPQVGELLTAYLEQNPKEAEEIAPLAATTQRVRNALAPKATTPLRAVPPARWHPKGSTSVRQFFGGGWGRLAASVALALGAGWCAKSLMTPAGSQPPLLALSHDASPATPGMGEVSHVSLLTPKTTTPAKNPQRYRLVWVSPLKRPQFVEAP